MIHDGYHNEYQEYTPDGDLVDGRNYVIKQLKSQLADYQKRDKVELKMREESIALQDAWNKYQTLLTLTQVDEA
jgi:hypothetical protein